MDDQQEEQNVSMRKISEYGTRIMDMQSPDHIVYDPETQLRYQLPGNLKLEELQKCYLKENDIEYLLDSLLKFNGGNVLDPRKARKLKISTAERKNAKSKKSKKSGKLKTRVSDNKEDHSSDQEQPDLFLGKPLTFVNSNFKSYASSDVCGTTSASGSSSFSGNSDRTSDCCKNNTSVNVADATVISTNSNGSSNCYESVDSVSSWNDLSVNSNIPLDCFINDRKITSYKSSMTDDVQNTRDHSTCSNDSINDSESSKENVNGNSPTAVSTPSKRKKKAGNRRKYNKYCTLEKVVAGLEDKTMIEGILRVTQKPNNEAYVTWNSDVDIFICGMVMRNRGLDGDKVVVKILPEDKWKNLGNGVLQKTGKVVYITEKNHPRIAVGPLVSRKYGNFNTTLCCIPRDNRLPVIHITSNTRPLIDVNELNNQLPYKKNMLYLVQIVRWDMTQYAEGVILEEVGLANSIETETKCILLENNIDDSSIDDCMSYLPDIGLIKPEIEAGNRLDLRDWCIFSIDPEGARDLDDALSCRLLPSGNYQVGIHISDVSYYIPADNQLDSVIMQRATSVYLNHIVYHMLPGELCDICSLTPGSDKLAFSVIVEMTKDAEIVSTEFCRSVIRSRGQFTYFHAQQVIEKGAAVLETPEIFPTMYDGMVPSTFVQIVMQLQSLAVILRENRFKNGALSLNQPKLQFFLKPETNEPEKFYLYLAQDSNRLIEEFMLVANNLVAKFIYEKFPKLALLRSHPEPNYRVLNEVVDILSKVSVDINVESAGSIQESINRYVGNNVDKEIVLSAILCKPMVRAIYTCPPEDGDINELRHYALNMPFYTHFTSPIRRYPDIVVHRFLAAALNYQPLPNWSTSHIRDIAETCNKKKNSSKKASDMCTMVFTKIYFSTHGPTVMDAVVTNIKDYSFDVLILPLGIIGRCFSKYISKNRKIEAVHKSENGVYNVFLRHEDPSTPEQVIKYFTKVKVEVYFDEKEHKIMTNFISITD